MTRLLKAGIVLIVLWAGLEVAAGAAASAVVERRVEAADTGARSTTAEIDSFPTATRLALNGEVKELTVTLDDVSREGISFRRIRVRIADLRLDRSDLIRGTIRPLGLARGSITAVASLDSITSEAGASLDLLPDSATAEVRDGTLVLGASGAGEISVGLPDDLLPRDPSATSAEGSVVLRCSVDAVPGFLRRPYQI